MRPPSAATPRCSRRVGGPATRASAACRGRARSPRAPAAPARARRPARRAGRRRSRRRPPRAAGQGRQDAPAARAGRPVAAQRQREDAPAGVVHAVPLRVGPVAAGDVERAAPDGGHGVVDRDGQVGQPAPAVASGVVEVDPRARGAVAPEAADDRDAPADGGRDHLAAGLRSRRHVLPGRRRRPGGAATSAVATAEEREHDRNGPPRRLGIVPRHGRGGAAGATDRQDASERRVLPRALLRPRLRLRGHAGHAPDHRRPEPGGFGAPR